MNIPKVSIMVPIYNVEKQIERCARSLFEQTLDDIEYVFVDDASPDKSIQILEQILEEYPARKSRVKIVRHKQNGKLWKALTTGLQNTSGEYIWHVDSDDYIALNAAAELYDQACRENSDIVLMNYADVFEDGRIIKRCRQKLEKSELLKQMLLGKFMPGSVLAFCSRKLYDEHNILPLPDVNMGSDYALLPRLVELADRVTTAKDILYFYCHENTESYCSVWRDSYLSERDRIYDEYKRFFAVHNPQMLEYVAGNVIETKCQFYRMYATAVDSQYADLLKINQWHQEVPLLKLIRNASLPYLPIIVLAYCRMNFLLKMYAAFCKFVYHKLCK